MTAGDIFVVPSELMNLVFLLYIMLFSVCDRCDICVVPSGADESSIFYCILCYSQSVTAVIYVWCRQELMNLVFLLYIMLFSVCDRCDICVVPSGADESSIFIVYYVILSL